MSKQPTKKPVAQQPAKGKQAKMSTKEPEPKHATSHERHVEPKPSPPVPPKPKVTGPPTYEVPDWFVNRYAADMIDLVDRARESGETESTVCQVEIVGSGNVGAITVYSDGKRVWSPDGANIESWLGYLKPPPLATA